jgi:hypothetical protein
MILVEAKQDRCGNIHVAPCAAKWRDKFRAVVRENGGGNNSSAFFQEGGPASEWLENDCPPAKRRELEQGYLIRFRADPWIVGHWYGYDAHTAAE